VLFALYKKHLEARLLAPGTVRKHTLSLTFFFRWLGEKDLRDVTLQDLLDYHQTLQKRRNQQGGKTSVGYRNSQMWVVCNFLTFLHQRKKLLINPAAHFPVLHKPRRLPKGVLTNEQVLRLLAQPNLQIPLGYRDRTILEFLYSTGLRGLELARLTIYDIDLKSHTVRVRQGKGGKDRLVPLGKTVALYLVEYLAQVRPILLARPLGKTAVDRLFLNDQGGELNVNVLRRLIKRHARSARLPRTTAAHGLRHACATEMLRGGASVRHVQELLGHSSLTTTQIYTRVVPVDLQRVHTATSPSERRKKPPVPTFDLKRFRDPKNKAYRKP
jgi:integrase/recombinase XerD